MDGDSVVRPDMAVILPISGAPRPGPYARSPRHGTARPGHLDDADDAWNFLILRIIL